MPNNDPRVEAALMAFLGEKGIEAGYRSNEWQLRTAMKAALAAADAVKSPSDIKAIMAFEAGVEHGAMEERAAKPPWRPIEEAPKDGSSVLVRCHNGQFRLVYWAGLVGRWVEDNSRGVGIYVDDATHFARLPPFAEEKKE